MYKTNSVYSRVTDISGDITRSRTQLCLSFTQHATVYIFFLAPPDAQQFSIRAELNQFLLTNVIFCWQVFSHQGTVTLFVCDLRMSTGGHLHREQNVLSDPYSILKRI